MGRYPQVLEFAQAVWSLLEQPADFLASQLESSDRAKASDRALQNEYVLSHAGIFTVCGSILPRPWVRASARVNIARTFSTFQKFRGVSSVLPLKGLGVDNAR